MPSTSIAIRPVEPGDAPALQANCLPLATVAAVREQIEANRHAFARGGGAQFVAEVAGDIVGNAVVKRDTQSPLYAHRAGLFSLVVSVPYQGRGIARRLVDAARAWAASQGIESWRRRAVPPRPPRRSTAAWGSSSGDACPVASASRGASGGFSTRSISPCRRG